MLIVVRTPKNRLFNYTECEELFNENKEDLGTNESFRQVLRNSDFYSFYDFRKSELLGCIYYYTLGKRLMVNAFATRGHHEVNLDCFRDSLKWYTCDVYAKALHRTSKMCLHRCGFKRLKGNLYKYRREKWADKRHQTV